MAVRVILRSPLWSDQVIINPKDTFIVTKIEIKCVNSWFPMIIPANYLEALLPSTSNPPAPQKNLIQLVC